MRLPDGIGCEFDLTWLVLILAWLDLIWLELGWVDLIWFDIGFVLICFDEIWCLFVLDAMRFDLTFTLVWIGLTYLLCWCCCWYWPAVGYDGVLILMWCWIGLGWFDFDVIWVRIYLVLLDAELILSLNWIELTCLDLIWFGIGCEFIWIGLLWFDSLLMFGVDVMLILVWF